jgi:hypothetical protein
MHHKLLLIEDLATELCSIEYYDHRVYLYSLDSFFIEVYQNIENKRIDRITMAGSGDLDKFIAQITLHPSLFRSSSDKRYLGSL